MEDLRLQSLALRLAAVEVCLLALAVGLAMMAWTWPQGEAALATFGWAAAVVAACAVGLWAADLYELRCVRALGAVAVRLPRAGLVAAGVLAGGVLGADASGAPIGLLAAGLVWAFAVFCVVRGVAYSVMRKGPLVERVLLIGTSPLGHALVEAIERDPHVPYAIVGVVDGPEAPARFGYLVVPLAELDSLLARLDPDRIVVTLGPRRSELPVQQLLAARMRGVVVDDGVELYERLTGKLAIESLKPSTLVYGHGLRPSRLHLALARAVSLGFALFGLVVLGPLLVVIAALVKLDSVGPVFFVHDRVGLGGRSFKLVKFRTMHPVTGTTSEWVRDNEDRVTRVGRWLRKFRLDELPQFVNVLRGDMNLVGPRPHPVSNYELFQRHIPFYALRCLVRPGITGWAQVRYGYANDLEEETEKMRYDLYYILHMSLWLDLRIIPETARTMVFGRGATQAAAPAPHSHA